MLVKKPLPDAAYLRKVLTYDPNTGILTWLPRPKEHFKTHAAFIRWNKLHAGKPAFASGKVGDYKTGALDGVNYMAHRIAWAHVYGDMGSKEIDHINGDRSDNRLQNLRAVSRLQNTQNRKLNSISKSGVCGVEWHQQCRKWKAYINANKRRVYLGVYVNLEDAIAARKAAEVKYGFHPNHGRS